MPDRHGGHDAQLIESVRNGDKDAFGILVQRYETRLYRVIYRFVNDRDLAEDLAQETFFRVYERLDQYDPARRFGPWLFQVGVNLTLDYLRKQKRRKKLSHFSDRSEDRSFDPGMADPRDSQEISQEVRHVLNMIPEKYRTVMVLKDLEGFSNSEIAAILKRKEATIRWRLALARQRFQEVWSQRMNNQSVNPSEEVLE